MFTRLLAIAFLVGGPVAGAGSPATSIPLFFVPAPQGGFSARGSGLHAAFTPAGVTFDLQGASLRLEFDGANSARRIEGQKALPGRVNYLAGERETWRSGVAIFGAVAYRDLYPGIDMVYDGEGAHLKSEFRVAPWADPSIIRIRYPGAGIPRVDSDGSLVVAVGEREVRELRPVAYQQKRTSRVAVAAAYRVSRDGAVSFLLGGYDPALPLVIDPVVVYSTLLGGSSSDSALAMAVDSTGAVYLAGYTASADFPTANPAQNLSGGGNDAFVAKLNAAGTALVYCTYLGGTGDDRAYGIAVDSTGSAYVTGSTASRNFPVAKAFQSKLAGSRNAFVVKLNAAGNALVFGSYLGGAASDTGYAIAVDSAGNSYITGDTTSSTFPATGFQKVFRGTQDAFVSKVSVDGSRLVYSTFLGGSASDHGAGIAVDASGNAYVTGSTLSGDFPVANAFQPSNAGGQDAFIAKVSSDGSALAFSTYFGGSGGSVSYPESGQGIALDPQGNIYVAGMTSSPNFPMLQPIQASLNGWEDGFVAKFTTAGWPAYSTYLGGSGSDYVNAIAVDASGNAYVAGYTYSTDLPVINAVQPNISTAGDLDAFVGILNSGGTALLYLSYLGGNGADTATAVALDPAGTVYVAGWTLSAGFPLVHPLQSVNGGNYGAFVWKMQQVTMRITCAHTGSFAQGQNGTYTVTVSNASSLPSNGSVTVSDTMSSGLSLVSIAGSGWTCVGSVCTRGDALAGGASYPPLTVTVKVGLGAASPQQNTAALSGGGDLLTHTAVDSTSLNGTVTYAISGAVTVAGSGIAGVIVTLSGSQAASVATDSAGNYAFTGLAGGGNYTVTPSGGYAFTPSSQSVTNLAANQVFSFAGTANLAFGKSASQSSTYANSVASLAVDGKTDGNYANGSISIAGSGTSPWWQVDLGASAAVSSLTIWGRTDCCANYLSDYWIFISDTPFNSSDTPATLQTRAGTWSSHQTTMPNPSVVIAAAGAQGRYIRVQLSGTGYLELAEVQLFGSWGSANLAQGKAATQSSTYSNAAATLAVDGKTDGVFANGSVSITGYGTSPWWQVDLGASNSVSSLRIWGRTDCCSSYLSDYWIFVSDVPFNSADTPATLQARAGTWSNHQTSAPNPSSAIVAGGAQGRYVRIQLTGAGYLELAEVQIFGNPVIVLSQGKTASQSATYSTAAANLSVDGKTDGVYADGSVSIAGYGTSPWWQVDLGASASVSSIDIWGRTDCCVSFLSDYWVFISDTPFNAADTPASLQTRVGTWSSHQTSAPSPTSVIATTGAQGRYIRVQLTGAGYLEMAEVQVFGAWR